MRMTWLIVAAATAGAAACGSSPKKGPPPPPPPPATADAAAEVRGVAQEAYGSLGHGKREGLLPLLADKVYVIGPEGGEPVRARSDVVVALSGMFPSDKKHRLSSHSLRAWVSGGGTSAYVWDQVDVDGVPYVATAVMAQEGGMWVATAVEVARAGGGGKGKASPTAAPPAMAAEVDAAAKDAVELFKQGAAAPERFLDQLAEGPEVVAIGPGAHELTRGGPAIQKAWKKALKKKPTVVVQGGVRAGATPDGQLAWVHANIERSTGKGEPSPRRAFYVYARDGAGWRLAIAHEAAVE
jgi:ketosteroid isomerase-like protein